jgi:hypothetical protein
VVVGDQGAQGRLTGLVLCQIAAVSANSRCRTLTVTPWLDLLIY